MPAPDEDPYAEDPAEMLAEAEHYLPIAIDELRDIAREESALAARKLTAISHVVALLRQEAVFELAMGPRRSGTPDEDQVAETAVVSGLAAVLGISEFRADRLSTFARRLLSLPDTHAALAAGRLDESRAWALVEASLDAPIDEARDVERALLTNLGDAPWDGASPRSWRARINRAVATWSPATAEERRQRAVADRAVRAFPTADGAGELSWRAPWETITMADGVIRDLAEQQPTEDEHGRTLSMDQRRSDALADLLRRVRSGDDLPRAHSDVDRVTLVLHADTFLGDGPSSHEASELRGLGQPGYLDYFTARHLAQDAISAGAAMGVFLTDTAGQLQHVMHLRKPTRTRDELGTAVREALAKPPGLSTDTYRPAAAIVRHVHARNPHCTSYDCPRVAARCDLDHNEPWPRGPTTADNLQPRCRRHHEHKTRRLARTSLHPDGSVEHQILGVIKVTTRPEALPGFA